MSRGKSPKFSSQSCLSDAAIFLCSSRSGCLSLLSQAGMSSGFEQSDVNQVQYCSIPATVLRSKWGLSTIVACAMSTAGRP